ncbi:glutamate 5-kinase [Sediminibacillus halophilus]|uniref:Glutamate 5-kinase n=1 Tax=Sediminibacillus halophilus TaxID=482461 RepID=A0A1G9M5D4_9BACI|nr:glutamate 5-kinase [Sediminibacillus halophilus]SDL69480.1 glutamate 5-kinase [Sediminibacillus halophilus]
MKKRVVVKIGSSSLAETSGGLSLKKLNKHVAALARFIQSGHQVILISSGAVAAGFRALGYEMRPETIKGKQAAAAVGQGKLLHAYEEAFYRYELVTAQMLMTRDVFSDMYQYSNAYHTLEELLKRSAIPIINENDSVAVDELTFGDNDMLAALVSGLLNADMFVLFTDIDGVYNEYPSDNTAAEKVSFIPYITESLLERVSHSSGSKWGTGGIKSKLIAAKLALDLGVPVYIGKNSGEKTLEKVIAGKGEGTYIGKEGLASWRKSKQWIGFHSVISGRITIDKGAELAIVHDNKSLLPAGVTGLSGNFSPGNVVEILNQDHQIIGKGQVHYSFVSLQKVIGMSSVQAMTKTGNKHPEVVHRDKMVIVKEVSHE